MKQVVIISGKGGTGKTVISAAVSSVVKDAVVSDCDVDASNLHLLLSPCGEYCLDRMKNNLSGRPRASMRQHCSSKI